MASRVCVGIAKFCRNLKFQQAISWKPYKGESQYFRWINVLSYSIYVSSLEEFWRGHLQSVVELKWNDPYMYIQRGILSAPISWIGNLYPFILPFIVHVHCAIIIVFISESQVFSWVSTNFHVATIVASIKIYYRVYANKTHDLISARKLMFQDF